MLQERAHILFPHVPTVSWLAPYHHGRSISIAGYPPREPSPYHGLVLVKFGKWCGFSLASFLEKMFFSIGIGGAIFSDKPMISRQVVHTPIWLYTVYMICVMLMIMFEMIAMVMDAALSLRVLPFLCIYIVYCIFVSCFHPSIQSFISAGPTFVYQHLSTVWWPVACHLSGK